MIGEYTPRSELSAGIEPEWLGVKALEVYDLLLSKLTRNSPKDIEDVQYVINREKLSFAKLRERFEEMRPVTGDRRTHELTLELWKDFFPDGSR
jgi:hypothetical protein